MNEKTIDDKKLIAANIYFNLYMDTLKKIVSSNGNILISDYGDEFFKFWIQKENLKCWVDWDFWEKFSELFSLEDNEIKSIITIWVEDTYQLKGINAAPYPT